MYGAPSLTHSLMRSLPLSFPLHLCGFVAVVVFVVSIVVFVV